MIMAANFGSAKSLPRNFEIYSIPIRQVIPSPSPPPSSPLLLTRSRARGAEPSCAEPSSLSAPRSPPPFPLGRHRKGGGVSRPTNSMAPQAKKKPAVVAPVGQRSISAFFTRAPAAESAAAKVGSG